MKHIKAILIFVLAIGLLAGCSSSQVKLIEEEGSYYLQVKTPSGTQSDDASQIVAPVIYFDTIEEMLNAIRTGTFTDEQMKELVRFRRDEQGRVVLFDMDHMLEPVFPSDYDDIDAAWTDTGYYFIGINSSMAERDVFYVISEEYYIEQTERFGNWDRYKNCDQVITENRDGVEVTMYDYDAGDELEPYPIRLCVYTLADADTELFILESYDVDIDLQTPKRVDIYGKSGDVYFQVHVYAFTTRPTPEWLLSFDLKPYTTQSRE